MAIEVRHGTGAAPVAAAAFGGAQGRARARLAGGAARASTQLELAKLAQAQQDKRLAQRAQEQQAGREFQAGQAQLGREHQLALGELSHGRGLERMEFSAGLQQEAAEAAQGRRRDDFEFQHTTKQRLELEQLAEAEAEIMRNPDFSEDEKIEARRRIAARRAGIKPVERPRQLTPQEKFEQSTFTHPDTGAIYPLDESTGRPVWSKPIYEPPERQPTVQDRIKAVQAAAAFAGSDDVTGQPNMKLFDQAMARMGFGPEEATQGQPGPAGAPAAGTPGRSRGMDLMLDAGGNAEGSRGMDLMLDAGGNPAEPAEEPFYSHGTAKEALEEFNRTLERPVAQIGAEAEEIRARETAPDRSNMRPRDVHDLSTAKEQIRLAREELTSLQAKGKGSVMDRVEKAQKIQSRLLDLQARKHELESMARAKERFARMAKERIGMNRPGPGVSRAAPLRVDELQAPSGMGR